MAASKTKAEVNATAGKRRKGTGKLRGRVGDAEKIAERRLKAIGYRKLGLSYRAISRQLGVSVRTAFEDVRAVLAELSELRKDSGEDYVELEVERLDAGIKNLAGLAATGDVAAIREQRRHGESRRKLLGLDAKTMIEHSAPGGGPLFTVVMPPNGRDDVQPTD